MGATSWEKWPSGVDWVDCLVMMKAIETLHGVLVTVTFTSTVFDGPSGVIAIAAFEMGRDASVMGQAVLGMSGEWPCKEHRRVEDCVFAGLYRLDAEIGDKMAKQNSLA